MRISFSNWYASNKNAPDPQAISEILSERISLSVLDEHAGNIV